MSIELFELRTAIIGENFPIKRAIPQRELRNIGHWVFLDHAGPTIFKSGEDVDVGAHPHIGLQTFTWMLQGEIIHNDSLGSDQIIRPYQINLMTGGKGIVHTELSHPNSKELHLAQLWIALPKDKETIEPDFKHYPELPHINNDDYEAYVLVGECDGHISPVEMHSPLSALDIKGKKDVTITLPLNPNFEYGLLPLEGEMTTEEAQMNDNTLAYIPAGTTSITLKLQAGSRALLIGGEPIEHPPLMWWNFVAWEQETIEEALKDWENHSERFPEVPYPGKSERLTAPPLTGKLKSHR